jgi:hypothetical protein
VLKRLADRTRLNIIDLIFNSISYVGEGEILATEPHHYNHAARDGQTLATQPIDETSQDHELHVIACASQVDNKLSSRYECDEDHLHGFIPYV